MRGNDMKSDIISVAQDTWRLFILGAAIALITGCESGPPPDMEPAPSPATPQPVFRSLAGTPRAATGSQIIESAAVEGGTASVSVDPSSGLGSLSFQKKDLKLEFGAGELPEDFPVDIPTPHNAKIVSVLHGPGLPTQVLFEVPMAYREFQPRYEEDLWRSNWILKGTRNIPKATGKILECTKANRKLTVTLKETAGSTLLTLRAEGYESPGAASGGE